jgi:hypothetical protein
VPQILQLEGVQKYGIFNIAIVDFDLIDLALSDQPTYSYRVGV